MLISDLDTTQNVVNWLKRFGKLFCEIRYRKKFFLYCSAQSPIYHNHSMGDNESNAGHVSTVPDIVLERSRQGVYSWGTPTNDLQLLAISGTPAWDVCAFGRSGEHYNPLSQIEFYHDSNTVGCNDDSDTALCRNSDTTPLPWWW